MIHFLFFALLFSVSLFSEDKITSHLIQLEKGPLAYKATVGTLSARDKEGNVKGEIGYTAYIMEGSPSNRPITFAFNGGPGSSSVWLHLGGLGPRRIVNPDEGQNATPPYRITDNLETLLDLTDLVFIDPIGSGFSKANSFDDAKPFYDVVGDIHAVGDFIHDFITVNKRWNSPKFLAGESYGTARAAGLAEYLQNEHSMYLNGVVMISCAIDFQTFFFARSTDNQLPFFLSLPTYTATAWHHGRYRPDATIKEVVDDAFSFVYETYVPLLFRNASMNKVEKETLYDRVAELSGLRYETVRRHKGKIHERLFLNEFFGDENKVLGCYDTRLTAEVPNPSYVDFFQDPSVSSIGGIMGGVLHEYLQNELDCSSSSQYTLLSFEAYENWNFFSRTPWGYPNLMDALRSAMIVNPKMQVFVASGYFDCVTPFAAAEYCFDHLDLPDAYKANVKMEYYEGGHMFYLSHSARKKFKQDMIQFYQQSQL